MSNSDDAKTDAGKSSAGNVTIRLDESKLESSYVNFFRVMGTPDEVILDVGFNPQAGDPNNMPPIALTQRLICNYVTAKRLLQTLNTTIGLHERAFGAVELDPRKRLVDPNAFRNS